jgi:hypothetical protein
MTVSKSDPVLLIMSAIIPKHTIIIMIWATTQYNQLYFKRGRWRIC